METRKPDARRNNFLNFLTVLILAAVLAVILFTLTVFLRPDLSINPFPPPTLPAAVVLWTTTPQTVSAPETAAPTQTVAEPAASVPPTPTVTDFAPQLTSSAVLAIQITPSDPAATPDYTSAYRYKIQAEPAAIAASLFESSRSDCEWMGVAGQVNDLNGSPVTGILVRLGGSLERLIQDQTTITGTARNYGESGYEFTLADHLVESQQTLWIQLVDQEYIPLSARVYFDTSADCGQSLVIINFKEVR